MPRRLNRMEDIRVLQRISLIVLSVVLLASTAACQQGNRSGGPNLEISDELKRTVVEIQSSVDKTNVDYATEGAEPRAPGARTYATTAEKDLLFITRFLEQREGRWQSFDGRSRKPNKQFTVIYGDKRRKTFGVEDHMLITPQKALQLSDEEYASIRRVCLNEG